MARFHFLRLWLRICLSPQPAAVPVSTASRSPHDMQNAPATVHVVSREDLQA